MCVFCVCRSQCDPHTTIGLVILISLQLDFSIWPTYFQKRDGQKLKFFHKGSTTNGGIVDIKMVWSAMQGIVRLTFVKMVEYCIKSKSMYYACCNCIWPYLVHNGEKLE